MSYIQWAANVNKIISDQTSLSIGEGAIQQETLASGGIKKSRLTCSNPPDKYSVVMAFNFVEKDSNGFTECDRFWAWYKGKHKYGMNPFEFPAILLNTNRQQGYSVEEQSYINRNGIQQNIPQTEYYCITSALEGSKSGNAIEIRMTWETYATGVITIPDDEYEIDRIEPYADRVDVILTSQPSTPPSITELDRKSVV